MKPLETIREFDAVAVHAVGPFGFISTGFGGVVHQIACRWQDVSVFRSLEAYYAATYPA